MKIGDKVFCINTRFNDTLNISFNTKGKIYTILDKNDISVSCDKNSYHIDCNYKFNYKDEFVEYWQFEEHFIPIKELRKQKLQKLHENR